MGLLNKVAFFANLTRAKVFNKYLPLTVIFNITDRCNSRCAYCYAAYYQRKKEELALEDVLKIIDELSKMQCKRVSFGGGEPLLRQDIGTIVSFVKKKGMDCVLNSNGYLVPQRLDIIKKVDALVLSLDGDRIAHDVYRGEGSFQRVMQAIECAYMNKIPLHTNTVLHKNNLNSIDFILDMARRYNFFAEFNLAIDCFAGQESQDNHKAGDEKIKSALEKLILRKKEGRNILFSCKALEYSLAWPSYRWEAFFERAPDFKHTYCAAGKYFCAIDTNGDVYPCPHLIDKMKARNARDGFANAFSGLSAHNCKACYQIYHNEFNLLFNFDLSVIYNYAKNSLKLSWLLHVNERTNTEKDKTTPY